MTPDQIATARRKIDRVEEIKNSQLPRDVKTEDYKEVAFELADLLSSALTALENQDRQPAQIRYEALKDACGSVCNRCERQVDVEGQAHAVYGVLWFHKIKGGNRLYVCRANSIRNLMMKISPPNNS